MLIRSNWLRLGLVGLCLLTIAGCGKPTPGPNDLTGTVSASGSTALLPLALRAKEIFEEENAFVNINVSGGGSFTGLNQVSSGAVDIGNSDVPATGETATGLVEHRVLINPFVLITHPDVPVKDVTLAQGAQILRGEITNWQQLGGPNQTITVVSRPQSSGSRATIVAKLLGGQGDITKDALVQDSNGKVLETVASTPGAIGYVDASYAKKAKVQVLALDGVPYSPEAVTSGKWSVFSYGYMYTKGEATDLTKIFLDFILSEEFQKNDVVELGFIPVTQTKQ